MNAGDRIRQYCAALTGCVLLLLCASPAQAQRLALESYAGNRPAGAAPVADLLRDELKAAYICDPAVVSQILSEHQTSPGMQNSRYNGDLFIKEVSDGSAAWSNTDFAGAQKRLDAAISNARQNPAAIARQPQAQEALRRALMLSALVNKRLAEGAHAQALHSSNPQAQAKLDAEERDYTAKRDARMGELIRSFSTPITRNDFGKEAEQLYLEAMQASAGLRRGKMVIALVDPVPKMTISVNELARQPGVISDLLPGPYRVLVQTPGGAREYAVDVRAGQTVEVKIDWNLDSVIETREWAGFRFPASASLELETAAIEKLLRNKAKIIEAATFTIATSGRKFIVTGSLYRSSGTLLRRGKLELESATAAANPERLRNLLAFLDGKASAKVTPIVKGATEESPEAPPTTPPRAVPPHVAVAPTTKAALTEDHEAEEEESSEAVPAPQATTKVPKVYLTSSDAKLLAYMFLFDAGVFATVGAYEFAQKPNSIVNGSVMMGASAASLLASAGFYYLSRKKSAGAPKYSVLATPNSVGVGYSVTW